MNNLEFNDQMADYMRLANLKNLTNTRLRGRADKQFADMQNPDLLGTATLPPPYMPEQPEIGNFDVRANLKIEPPPMQQGPAAQDGGIWSKIANGLKTIGGGRLPEQEDEPEIDNMAASLMPPQMGQSVPLAGPKTAQSMLTPQGQANILTGNRELPNGEMLKAGIGFDPMATVGLLGSGLKSLIFGEAGASEPPLPEQPQNPLAPPLAQEQLPQEDKEPGSYAQPGAVAAVVQNPKTKAEIERIFGTTMDANTTKIAEDYALAMSNYGTSLDALGGTIDKHIADIKQRIESRDLTTQDKIFMAIALIAPAIMGGIVGGKEGLIGALGGGAQGLADVLGGRAKDTKEDQDSITALSMDKAKIGKEKLSAQMQDAEFKQKLRESIPNKGLRDLVNRDGELNSKGELVLNTGNPLLPLRSNKIREPEDYKRFKEKEMPDLEKKIGQVQSSLKLVDEMNNLLDQVDAVEKSGVSGAARSWIPFYDPIAKVVKSYIPVTRDTVQDENGNTIKLSELFNSYREGLMDAQRQFFSGGKNSEHYQEHFFRELPNPFESKAFWEGKANWAQTKKQINVMKDRLETAVLNELDVKGIDTGPVRSLFGSSETNKNISDSQRKRDRVNQAVEQSTRGK